MSEKKLTKEIAEALLTIIIGCVVLGLPALPLYMSIFSESHKTPMDPKKKAKEIVAAKEKELHEQALWGMRVISSDYRDSILFAKSLKPGYEGISDTQLLHAWRFLSEFPYVVDTVHETDFYYDEYKNAKYLMVLERFGGDKKIELLTEKPVDTVGQKVLRDGWCPKSFTQSCNVLRPEVDPNAITYHYTVKVQDTYVVKSIEYIEPKVKNLCAKRDSIENLINKKYDLSVYDSLEHFLPKDVRNQCAEKWASIDPKNKNFCSKSAEYAYLKRLHKQADSLSSARQKAFKTYNRH